jgi:hypothetical protein
VVLYNHSKGITPNKKEELIMKKCKGNKTFRNTFAWLIGYDFGANGYYNGCYYDEYTNEKQYEFIMPDGSSFITDYNGFKEVINKYDYPRR